MQESPLQWRRRARLRDNKLYLLNGNCGYGTLVATYMRNVGMRAILSLLVAALFAVAALPAQVVPGRYVVELSGEPALRSPFAAARRDTIRRSQAEARRAVAQHGGTVIESMDTVVNALIVTIPEERAGELAQSPGAVRVHPVRRVRAFLSYALPVHKVPQAWAMLPLGQESAGTGVKIAIIDTGIDVNHPSFADSLPALAGFPKVLSDADRRFTNSKIIVAKNYTPLLPDRGDPDANDRNGHGTGTALAAAGGFSMSPYGGVTGVAPKAYIGNYKVLDANGGTSDVIAKAIDDAVADGMDVINLSLGSFVLSYDDISLGEVGIAAIQAATRAGVVVTVAGGNEGPGSSTISDYASAPDAISMGAIHNSRSLGYALSVSGGSPYQAYTGSGANPTAAVSGTLLDAASLDGTGQACSPFGSGTAVGSVMLVLRGPCTFEIKANNAAAAGAVAIVIYNNDDLRPFRSGGQDLGSATLPVFFLNQLDGLALKARMAAASDLTASLDFSGAASFPARTDLTGFSSRGPSLGSALKPDLVAVGEEIVTGAQKSFVFGESYDPSGFINTAGTSFSAPLAAGSAAVLRAARPGMTVAQYRSLLINSATPATAGLDLPATVSQAGSGVLNLAAALSGTVAAYPTALNFGTGSNGAFNRTLTLSLTNIRMAGDSYSVTAVPRGSGPVPVVTTDSLDVEAGGSRDVSVNLNAFGLSPGEYQGYLNINSSTGNTARVPYWFAVPGATPAGISILYQDYTDPQNSAASGAVIFRVVDQAGLPYTGSLRPTVVAGGGIARSPYRVGNVSATYAIDVRMGDSWLQLAISIGDLTANVTIAAN